MIRNPNEASEALAFLHRDVCRYFLTCARAALGVARNPSAEKLGNAPAWDEQARESAREALNRAKRSRQYAEKCDDGNVMREALCVTREATALANEVGILS